MSTPPWIWAARRILAVTTLAFGAATAAHAAGTSMLHDFRFDKPVFIHQHPFADYKLVLQVSEDNPAQWQLALNNAENVLQYFGQDKAEIVVVAFGPGLKMFFKNSPMAAQIAAENSQGVEFDACDNTLKAMAKKLGHTPELLAQAEIVPAGVVRIMQLEHAGFAFIKP